MKKIISISLLIFIITSIAAGTIGCRFRPNQSVDSSIEHHVADRFIYFTGIDGENTVDIEMDEGEHDISVAMDNGELWIKLSKDGKVYLDTDATFSSDYTVDIDEAWTYELMLKGENASGSVNY